MSNAAGLITAITDAVPNDAIGLIVDLSEVGFMDSAGVRVLLELAKRLEWRGQALRVVVAEDARIHRVLKVSGVHDVVAIDGSLASAFEHLGAGT